MAICLRCSERVPDRDLLTHLRIMHPDVWEPLDTWPDGRPVIVDCALEPGEFT